MPFIIWIKNFHSLCHKLFLNPIISIRPPFLEFFLEIVNNTSWEIKVFSTIHLPRGKVVWEGEMWLLKISLSFFDQNPKNNLANHVTKAYKSKVIDFNWIWDFWSNDMKVN